MQRIVIAFDVSAYTVDAVQRACYKFSDRLSSELVLDESVINCVLFIESVSEETERIVSDFRNEVLDQVLRERIRTETEPVRNMILALAFSKTGLTDPSV